MRVYTLLCALGAPSLIAATALTYRLAPSETACFFTSVDTAGSKIAFYFAVCGFGAFSDHLVNVSSHSVCCYRSGPNIRTRMNI